MGRIDKELALRMMLDGKGDRSIADHFGTSRQAVNLLRKSFVNEGKLQQTPPRIQKPEAPRQGFSSPPQADSLPPRNIGARMPRAGNNSQAEPSYEQITRWIVRLVTDAAEVAKLRQDLSDARAQLADLQAQIRLLRDQLEHAKQDRASVMAKAAEYQQAIQQLRASGGTARPAPQDDSSA